MKRSLWITWWKKHLKKNSSWWLNQPIWKISVKMEIFPNTGVKIKHIWNQKKHLKKIWKFLDTHDIPDFQVLPSEPFLGVLSIFKWPFQRLLVTYIWVIKRSLGWSWFMDFNGFHRVSWTFVCLLLFFLNNSFRVTNISCEHILHSDHCSSTRSAMPWNPRE